MPEGLDQTNENEVRRELHRLVKETVIASQSTAYNAKEREEKAEKELEELLKKHPEFTEKAEEISEHYINELRKM